MPPVAALQGALLLPSPWLTAGPLEWTFLATSLALAGWGGARIARRRDALRGRLYALRESVEAALEESARFSEAGAWIRLMGAPAERARQLEQACRQTTQRARKLADRLGALERQFEGWRLRALASGLAKAEAQATALAHDRRQVRAALASLHDERRTSEHCLETTVERAEKLLERLAAPAGTPWLHDLDEAARLARAALAPAERAKRPGGALETLQECQAIDRELDAIEAELDSRLASASWLAMVPEEAARLTRARARLAAEGLRELPEVPAARWREQAASALEALAEGRLDTAGHAQRALRRELQALHRATVGVEELRARNARELGRLRAEWEALGRRLAALPPAELRERFAERQWRALLPAAAEAESRRLALGAALEEAERANGLTLQRFSACAAALRGLDASLGDVGAMVRRAEAGWAALPVGETRLQSRLRTLRVSARATGEQAIALGMAADPALVAMLDEAKAALAEQPIALDEAARALAAAELLHARLSGRLAELDRRLARGAEPRHVWIMRLDPASDPSRRAHEQKK